MRVSDLLEERSRLKADAESIINAAEAANRLPNEDEQRKLDEIRSKAKDVDQRIQNQAMLDELDRAAPGTKIGGGADVHWDRQVRSFSLQRAIASQIDPSAVDGGREREISQELAKRAGRTPEGILCPLEALVPERRVLTKGSGDADQLVQTSVLANEFIDALRPASITSQLGARALTGMRGDVALPKMDALTPAAEWIAENSALTGGDHSFTQVTGTPKHLGILTEYSRKVALQTNPQIEDIIRGDFMAKLGVGLDLAVLKGTGSGPQPTGITQTSGIFTLNSSGQNPQWSLVVDVMGKVENADVPLSTLGWAMNAKTKAKMRATAKASVDVPEYLMGDTNTLGGLPVGISSQLDGDDMGSPTVDGEVIFGAWNQVITVFWSGIEILVNPYASTAYSKGNVQIRGIVDADVLVRHPQAFCHWYGISVE